MGLWPGVGPFLLSSLSDSAVLGFLEYPDLTACILTLLLDLMLQWPPMQVASSSNEHFHLPDPDLEYPLLSWHCGCCSLRLDPMALWIQAVSPLPPQQCPASSSLSCFHYGPGFQTLKLLCGQIWVHGRHILPLRSLKWWQLLLLREIYRKPRRTAPSQHAAVYAEIRWGWETIWNTCLCPLISVSHETGLILSSKQTGPNIIHCPHIMGMRCLTLVLLFLWNCGISVRRGFKDQRNWLVFPVSFASFFTSDYWLSGTSFQRFFFMWKSENLKSFMKFYYMCLSANWRKTYLY